MCFSDAGAAAGNGAGRFDFPVAVSVVAATAVAVFQPLQTGGVPATIRRRTAATV